MTSAQEKGRDFERELAEELGLSLVPGSGNQWFAKLDLAKGSTSKWSLKFTEASSFRLTQDDITEAVDASQGLSGDGSIPVWAIRIGQPEFDMIVLRKNDFLLMQEGEVKLVGDDKPRAGDQRRARSRVPVLLRED